MDFFDKVSSMAKEIADGAKGVAGNAKISFKISAIERKISELNEKLGAAVWSERSGKNEVKTDSDEAAENISDIDAICAEIDGLYSQIDELNAQREALSKEAENEEAEGVDGEPSVKRSCVMCDAVLEDEWLFCPVCGEPIVPIEPEPEKEEEPVIDIEPKEEISYDDFAKLQFQVGEIIACEAVPKSKKLLCSQVKIGSSVKQIVSGIKAHYTPEEMVGKKVMVLVNLKPAKLAGVLSEGMLLCAEDAEGNLALMTPEKAMPAGAEIC